MAVKKQSYLQGAMILTASTLIVKVIGMFYKIPIGNILGAVGMSYFMTAYNIFNPIYALSVAGFPVAVSKLVAESAARHNYREVRRIFKASFLVFIVTGTIGFAVLFFGAKPAAYIVGNPDAYLSIIAIAPAIFFCCIISAYRGYYQGLGNMTPTAASQVIEALVKLVCGVAFAVVLLDAGMKSFYQNGTIFGKVASSVSDAENTALVYASAGAILGVSVSVLLGSIYLLIRHMAKADGITKDMLERSSKPKSGVKIIKNLTILAFPVCVGSVLTNITGLIDVATIMKRIAKAITLDGGYILAMYNGRLPDGIALDEVPRYLYGAYSYCSSLFNLIPALTIPLGISALPLISAHFALKNRSQTTVIAQSVIKLSSLVAIPSGLGLCALARPVLELLYPSRIQEVLIAAPILETMGVAAMLLGITAPFTSIFQAIGRADVPVKLMAVGAALKIITNWYFLAVPKLNINAAPYATILCYFFIFTASLVYLQNELGIKINLLDSFIKPLFCGILCAFSAKFSYIFLQNMIITRILCLISIGIGGTIYVISILCLRIITKNEVLLIPGGKKIAKILEKLSLLG